MLPIMEELRRQIVRELNGKGEGRYPSFNNKAINKIKDRLDMPHMRLSVIVGILEEEGADQMEIINLLLFNAQENFYEKGMASYLWAKTKIALLNGESHEHSRNATVAGP